MDNEKKEATSKRYFECVRIDKFVDIEAGVKI
jgi:hypothetical protein